MAAWLCVTRTCDWVGVYLDERSAEWVGQTTTPGSAWISVQIQSRREASSYYRWAGKQKILAGIPRRRELHINSTWLCLEPLCTQMKNELVLSVRASGSQHFSESRKQPGSQACLGPCFWPWPPPLPCICPLTPCLSSPRTSVGCAT